MQSSLMAAHTKGSLRKMCQMVRELTPGVKDMSIEATSEMAKWTAKASLNMPIVTGLSSRATSEGTSSKR